MPHAAKTSVTYRAAVALFPLLMLAAIAPALPAQQRTAESPRGPRDPMQEGLPLRPARSLSFSTKVGNWMSLDVSSDGQTLVFDLLGDLYTLPLAGGKATSLTRGMAFDGQPRFSPDGKKIVFVSDRDGGWNVWTMSVDKRDTTQVTRGKTNQYESPEFTPDGKFIVVTRGTKLWMFHVDGGGGQQIIRTAATPAPGGPGGGQADVLRQTVCPAPRLLDLQHADERLRPRGVRPRVGPGQHP